MPGEPYLIIGVRQILRSCGDRDSGVEARGNGLAGPPRLDAGTRRTAWARGTTARTTVAVTPISRRAKEPQATMIIVGKGVQEAESDAAADVGDDIPRGEVAHACV